MSDFQERLAAADPVGSGSYAHRDPEAMLARIVTHNPMRRDGVLRTFKLKMAGAVTMASLVTVGGIAVLQSTAPGLPLLALASAGSHKSISASLAHDFSTAKRINEEFAFTPGPGFTSSATTASAYRLQVPSSASAEVTRITSILGVTGTSSPFVSVSYESSGVPQWSYSNDSTVAPPSRSSLTTFASIEANVQKYLVQLGYGYTATNPLRSNSMNQKNVSYRVVVDGIMTDQNVRFTFDSNNVLTYASGPAFYIDSAISYPLQSHVAGVDVLNDQQRNYFAPRGGSALGPNASASTTSLTPTSASSSSRTGPPIVGVTLDSVTTTLQSVTLINGSVWLVPDFVYTGMIKNADGSTTSGTWTTIAIDPSFVKLSVAKGPITR
jgi:hypothetical protein